MYLSISFAHLDFPNSLEPSPRVVPCHVITPGEFREGLSLKK